MIEVRNLTKSFGSLQVLRGVNLSVERGEVISIVGPSGAGKTTLLQLIGALDTPDGGSIMFDGRALGAMNGAQLAKFRNAHIGFVFQFHQLLPEFTAIENVAIPALIAGRSLAEANKEAMELLALMGLADRAHHKPSQLSGGENQRVAVARALVNRPDVILADEPSGSLDSRNKEELHRLFFDLRDKFGQTFIIVTHDEGLAAVTDRTIRMVDGVVSM
ncbi:MAG: ABC transporter ATP-binding protein [Bacteroidaceae bacterium]|nr:ABC transporter ATP-binding protein [Bacteroidaceae bacterium]